MGLELRGTSCSIWRTAFLVSALIVLAGTVVPDEQILTELRALRI